MKVTDDDNGYGRCIAENRVGSHSIQFSLDVYIKPKIRNKEGITGSKKTLPIIITSGRTLRLDCRADGNPKPKATWSRSGMPIANLDSEKYKLINGG